jgi:hypothetical protein
MELDNDSHTRSAQLLFRSEHPSKDERNIAKVLNLFAARGLSYHDNRRRDRMLIDHGLSQAELDELVYKYKQRVLGITEGPG